MSDQQDLASALKPLPDPKLDRTPRQIVHRLWAEHPHWYGSVYLFNDGTMSRPNGDRGRYSLIPMRHLILDWDRWSAEHLSWDPALGIYRNQEKHFSVRVCPPPSSLQLVPSNEKEDHSNSKFDDSTHNIIWSQTLRLAYYPVPKNACSSIKSTLLTSVDMAKRVGARLHANYPSSRSIHLEPDLMEFAPVGTTSACEAMMTFAVIRHPLDRLVSCYANKVEQKCLGLTAKYKSANNFEAFASLVLQDVHADEHFAPLVSQLPKQLDACLRFEFLEEDWNQMRHHHGLDLPDLPRRNPSIHENWERYYPLSLRQRVESIYADDLELYARSFAN